MRLNKWVINGGTYTFGTAQSTIGQTWRFPRDGVSLLGAIGSYPALGDSNPMQELSVSVTLQFAFGATVNGVALTGWTEMVQAIQNCIETLLAGQGQLYAIREDNTQVWAWAKVSQMSRPSLATRRRLVELPVTFLIEDTWYDDTAAGAWNFDDGYYFDTGLYFDATELAFVGVSTTENMSIPNDGTAPARDMTITITTSSGTVTNPKLTNAANSLWFQWTGTVSTGTITVNPATMSILSGTANAYSALTIGTAQMEWMRFEPGMNIVTFACTGGGAANVTFNFYPPYWEA